MAPLLHQVLPSIPEALSLGVNRALAKNPNQRYANCISFARAALDAVKATAPPPPVPSTVRSFAVAPATPLRSTVTRPSVTCPSCGLAMLVPATAIGKRVRCQSCRAQFRLSGTTAPTQPSAPRQAPETGKAQQGVVDTLEVWSEISPAATAQQKKRKSRRLAAWFRGVRLPNRLLLFGVGALLLVAALAVLLLTNLAK